jgi:hypothetical protein
VASHRVFSLPPPSIYIYIYILYPRYGITIPYPRHDCTRLALPLPGTCVWVFSVFSSRCFTSHGPILWYQNCSSHFRSHDPVLLRIYAAAHAPPMGDLVPSPPSPTPPARDHPSITAGPVVHMLGPPLCLHRHQPHGYYRIHQLGSGEECAPQHHRPPPPPALVGGRWLENRAQASLVFISRS